MKCPKCGYLGFEDVERCRNCGYDFSLAAGVAVPDIAIRRDTRALTPLDDLSLIDSSAASGTPAGASDFEPDLDRVFGAPDPIEDAIDAPIAPGRRAGHAPRSAKAAMVIGTPDDELPLFGPPIPDDEPLITRAAPPRAPLAVRRSTPDVPRVRAEATRPPSFDLGLDEPPREAPVSPAERAAAGAWTEAAEPAPAFDADAGVGARLVAVVLDLLILAATDALVIYFTMQICGLTLADVDILPKGPLLAFLIVQNGGYLVAFTAGGQTLGKMAAGIRVVPADAHTQLDLGRAFLRTFMWVLLAVPAGLGFISAIVSRDRRGLHDRFAGTRVVRASA